MLLSAGMGGFVGSAEMGGFVGSGVTRMLPLPMEAVGARGVFGSDENGLD